MTTFCNNNTNNIIINIDRIQLNYEEQQLYYSYDFRKKILKQYLTIFNDINISTNLKQYHKNNMNHNYLINNVIDENIEEIVKYIIEYKNRIEEEYISHSNNNYIDISNKDNMNIYWYNKIIYSKYEDIVLLGFEILYDSYNRDSSGWNVITYNFTFIYKLKNMYNKLFDLIYDVYKTINIL